MVAADVGSTDDPQALAFWQSSDVLGFSDYQRLFMFLEHADAAEQEAGMQNVHIVIVSLIKEHFAMCTSHLLQQADANRCKTPTCCICPGGSGTSQGTSSQVCTDLGIEERLLQSRQDGRKHFENMAYGRMTSKVSKVLMSFPNLRDRSFGPLGRLVWETSDD